MPRMSAVEAAVCRSGAWAWFARTKLLPWALRGHELAGAVLEIGVGNGVMARTILQQCPQARVTVTDYNRAMVEAVGTRLTPWGARAAVRMADASALPFPDASFNVVLSLLMLHHTLTWGQVLAEAGRALRPGGTLIGYDVLDTASARWLHRADRSPHRLLARTELATALAHDRWAEPRTRCSRRGGLVQFVAHREHAPTEPEKPDSPIPPT